MRVLSGRLSRRKALLEERLERLRLKDQAPNVNFLLITLDSCRYDAYCDARTAVLAEFGPWLAAQSPANYTYAAHQSFFVGLLPHVADPIPYYNRFTRQLIGLMDAGEQPITNRAYFTVASSRDAVDGMRRAGFQAVGTGAMNWFRQSSLTSSFERFKVLEDADSQINYHLRELDLSRPFFSFMNFGETHDPFNYRGKKTPCPVRIQARRMTWPPVESGPVGREHEAYWHQVEAIEYLDGQIGRLFAALPSNTIAVICGDHGECFGEDGYWGHAVNHPKVFEVPLGIFRLDGQAIEAEQTTEVPASGA